MKRLGLERLLSLCNSKAVRLIVFITLTLLGLILFYCMGTRIGEFIYYIKH